MKLKKKLFSISLFLPLLAVAFGDEWIAVAKSQSGDKTYYLNPQSLKPDIRDHFQIGLIILHRETGVEFSDLQVTGCDQGHGNYKVSYEGDKWRKPQQWNRVGVKDFDHISLTMCEMIRECKSSYQSLIAKRKAGQKIDYPESGKYFKDMSVSYLEMQCKDGS